jgi:ActD protein
MSDATADRADARPGPWGLLAEFATADALVDAAARARQAGYTDAEAYSPFVIDGLADALGFKPSRVAATTLIGAVAGGLGAYFMQWYAAVVAYPEVIGGRPLHSWPMFIPITFEMTVLGGALAAVAALFVGSRLPRLHHPLFSVPEFDLASRNRFFLCLRSDDPAWAGEGTRAFLAGLGPIDLREVAPT